MYMSHKLTLMSYKQMYLSYELMYVSHELIYVKRMSYACLRQHASANHSQKPAL